LTDRDFLSRWSQRKARERINRRKVRPRAFAPVGAPFAAEHSVEGAPPQCPGQSSVAPEPENHIVPLPAATEEAKKKLDAGDDRENNSPSDAEASLPDLESLDYESDYSAFMAEGVSDQLRSRALRRLWRSNPVLANVDGLNDYDEDFTFVTSSVMEGLKSAYKAIGGYGDEAAKPCGAEEERVSERAPSEAAANETAEANSDFSEAEETQDENDSADAAGVAAASNEGATEGDDNDSRGG
jgi:hypothetical protein